MATKKTEPKEVQAAEVKPAKPKREHARAMKQPPQKPIPKKRGRPGMYTDKLADEIIERMEAGERLTSICRDPHMPRYGTLCDWEEATIEVNGIHTLKYPKFSARFARARVRNAEYQLIEAGEFIDEAAEPIINARTGRPFKDEKGRILTRLTREAIAHATSRASFRQWIAERLVNRYRPKQTIEQTGANGGPIQTANANANFDHSSLVDAFKEVIKKGI
jgi:hypothetical protein